MMVDALPREALEAESETRVKAGPEGGGVSQTSEVS